VCHRPNVFEASPIHDDSAMLVFRAKCDTCGYDFKLMRESIISFASVIAAIVGSGLLFVHYLPDSVSGAFEALFFIVLVSFEILFAILFYFSFGYLFNRSSLMSKYMEKRIKKLIQQ